MHYSQLRTSILANWKRSNKIVPYVEGLPGLGKSALGRQLAKDLGVLPEHYVEFNLSNRQETDIIGLPNNSGECAKWVPPEEFWRLRDIPGDDRPRFLLVEEMSDGGINMQNPMCRVLYDRHAADLKLHRNLFIYTSGNKVEHKSGANRLITKLAGRVQRVTMDFNFDDFRRFWIEAGLDPLILGALRWKQDMICDFDPLREQNPTPRTWEFVAHIDPDLPKELYLRNAEGFVGNSGAIFITSFRELFAQIHDPDLVVADPGKFTPPSDPGARYASISTLVPRSTKDVIEPLLSKYISKFPLDIQVAYVQDCILTHPEVRNTREVIKFMAAHSNVIFG